MLSWYGHDVRLVMRWVIVHGYKLYCERETMRSWYGSWYPACDEVSDSSWLQVLLRERDYAELIWPWCPACDEVSDSSWLQVILQERERDYVALIWPRCRACDEVSDSSWWQVILWERVCAELTRPRCPACDEVSDNDTVRESDHAELIWPRCPAWDEVSHSSWLQVILRERDYAELISPWCLVMTGVIVHDYKLYCGRERLCWVEMATMSGLWWGEW